MTAVFKDGVVTLHNVDGASEEGIKLGSVPITGLTFIPDYVSSDGSPMVVFSSLSFPDGSAVSTSIQLRFRVNPSNATTDQIDTQNLTFIHHSATKLRANDKLHFGNLRDGILTVSVNIYPLYLSNDPTRVDQLALQVPFKDSNAVVTSNWVMAFADKITAGISFDGTKEVSKELPKTIGGIKAPFIVDMNERNLDLSKYAHAMFRTSKTSSDADFDDNLVAGKYGANLVFELVNESDTPIPVDQQNFIRVEGKSATIVGDSSESSSKEAIVRVSLMYAPEKITIVKGYFKIKVNNAGSRA